jgi:ketopantoate reductase
MTQPVVIIGIGELGGVFAKAFLRTGCPLYPVLRSMHIATEAKNLPNPQLALVAVAEKDFQTTMAAIPAQWRNRLGLLQNELLPRNWKAHNIKNPTVISVWFEKKRGMHVKVLIPSRVYGPQAQLVADALKEIDIPCNVLNSERDLLYELVLKNVFVFTINIAGLVLEDGTTTEILWTQHNEMAREIAAEVIDIQELLTGASFDRQRLINGFKEGVKGDPNHKCRGRSAPGRLDRMIAIAREAGLQIPRIKAISQSQPPKD